MFKTIFLAGLIGFSFISNISMENKLPADYCPFIKNDIANYVIRGEWKSNDINYGNNTGVQKIIVFNRTKSEIEISESKTEKIEAIVQGMPKTRIIEVSSYWKYNISSRSVIDSESYASLWIKIDNKDLINSEVRIFHYLFKITEQREFCYLNQVRTSLVAIYKETTPLSSGFLYSNSFELWYDRNTGIMLYYISRFSLFDTKLNVVEWSYYSTYLNYTTVDLSYCYFDNSGVDFVKKMEEPIVLFFLFVISIILISTIIIIKNHVLKKNKFKFSLTLKEKTKI